MSFIIIARRDKNDPEPNFYGPFNTLGEVDDWQDHFSDVVMEYSVHEMTLEPREFIQYCAGITAALELKHNLYLESFKEFDFLGYWQAGVTPKEVIKIILEKAL